MAVTLTESAAQEIKRMIAQQQLPEQTRLRVGVAGGGCSGFEYKMDFDREEVAENDRVAESHGVTVVVDEKSVKFLEGTEIDFRQDLINRGFVFNNPLATKKCGCGTSFQV